MQNLLDPKTQRYFQWKFGGTLAIKVIYDPEHESFYFEAWLKQYKRFEPIITIENLISLTLSDGEISVNVSGSGGVAHLVNNDQFAFVRLTWCGITAAGQFHVETKDDGERVVTFEPDEEFTPYWWNHPNWEERTAR